MELGLLKKTINCSEKIYEGSVEHIDENDLIVPDYLPDVGEIISSQARISISEKASGNGSLQISGNIYCTVLYMPDGGKSPKAINVTYPLRKTIDASYAGKDTFVRASGSVNSVKADILNSRKISIRFDCALKIEAYNNQEIEIGYDVEKDDSVELLRGSRCFYVTQDIAAKEFGLSEELEIPRGNLPLEEVLYSNCTFSKQETKMLSNKIIVKLNANITTVYVSDKETGELDVCQHEIPFTQIIDSPEITEKSIVDVSVNCHTFDIKPKEDNIGNCVGLQAEITGEIEVTLSSCINADVVDDAYCTTHDAKCVKRAIEAEELLGVDQNQVVVKEVIPLEGQRSVDKIISFSASPGVKSISPEAGNVLIDGIVEVEVLCQSGEGENKNFFTLKHELPLSYTYQTDEAGRSNLEVRLDSASTGYNLNISGEIEVRAVIDVIIKEKLPKREDIVTGITIAEAEKRNERPSLIIYFPQRGETLWDIGKRYSARVSEIKELNGIAESEMPTGAIMIPKCRN